ncbi:hypothetical protein ACIHFE_04615 [Streptomyces sp. NPDC052396]|uniref:hypothetical protein n=1 Tax=Streptomyces sp. NPDC052396 TaxID=3365689 RepID=UPI0037D28E62
MTKLVDQYTASLRDACEDLKNHRSVFTGYGRMLLDELCSFAEHIDFGQVADTISSPEFAGYQPAVFAD